MLFSTGIRKVMISACERNNCLFGWPILSDIIFLCSSASLLSESYNQTRRDLRFKPSGVCWCLWLPHITSMQMVVWSLVIRNPYWLLKIKHKIKSTLSS